MVAIKDVEIVYEVEYIDLNGTDGDIKIVIKNPFEVNMMIPRQSQVYLTVASV